jgi:hypothetical protein
MRKIPYLSCWESKPGRPACSLVTLLVELISNPTENVKRSFGDRTRFHFIKYIVQRTHKTGGGSCSQFKPFSHYKCLYNCIRNICCNFKLNFVALNNLYSVLLETWQSRNSLLLWTSKVHYRHHKRPLLDAFLSQFATTQRISFIHFKTILPSTTGGGGGSWTTGVRVSPPRPDLLWGPPSLRSSGHRGLFPGGKAVGAKLTTHFHLGPRPSLRKCGDVTPIPHTSYWRDTSLKHRIRLHGMVLS